MMIDEEAAQQQPPPSPASSWPKEVRVDVIDGGASSSKSCYRLWRVPKHVRAINEEAYGPKFVCIGPYHRGGGGDGDRVEKLKERYRDELLKDVVGPHDDDRTMRDEILLLCRCRLEEMVDSVRRFYAEEEYVRDMKDEEIVRMLLHDGCFIIKHLYNFAMGYNEEELHATRWAPAQLRIDLALLENQIPFFVLEKIFHHLTPRSLMPKITRDDDETMRQRKKRTLIVMAMWYMLDGWFRLPERKSDKLYELVANEEVHHLLHLVHIAHLVEVNNAAVAKPTTLRLLLDLCCAQLSCVFIWPLRFLMSLLLCMCCCHFRRYSDEPIPMEEIASATQLRAVGVKIRRVPREHGGILNVRFIREGHRVTLEIPQLFVNQATMPMLQNLVAYEQQQGPSWSSDWWRKEDHFTMYAFLMYNLVRTTEDIAVLQGHGVLFNNLGSHQSVIDYFQNLCNLWPIRGSDVVNHIAYAMHKLRIFKQWRDQAIQLFLLVVSVVVTLCTIGQTIIAIIYRKS